MFAHWGAVKYRLRLFLTPLLTLIALVVTAMFIAPGLIGTWASHNIVEACKGCKLEIGGSRFDPLARGFVYTDVSFSMAAGPGDIAVHVSAPRIVLRPAYRDLITGRMALQNARFDEPTVTLTEQAGEAPKEVDDGKHPNLPKFVIHHTQVQNGHFRFVSRKHQPASDLRISGIHGHMTHFFLHNELSTYDTECMLEGSLEKAGTFRLALEGNPLPGPNQHAAMDLSVTRQELAPLNPYFDPAEGLRMKGLLHHGRAQMRINGHGHLSGKLNATYSGFELDVRDHEGRTGIMTALTRLGARLKFKSENLRFPEPERVRPIEGDKRPDEHIVSAVLRVLGETVIKVAG